MLPETPKGTLVLAVILVSVFAAAIVACGLPAETLSAPTPSVTTAPTESATPPPTSTATTTTTSTPAPATTPTTPPAVLFSDDFSDPDSGWDRRKDTIGRADYADDAYQVRVNEGNSFVAASPGLDYADVRLEVDATQIDGLDQVVYGIICRYQDARNFYALVVTGDRRSGILKMQAGEFSILGRNHFGTTTLSFRVGKGAASAPIV